MVTRHHVGGQPEVGIQHGPHHLHGVPLHGQVVGDDQRGEPRRGRHRGAEALPVHAFQHQSQDHRRPADEHRRGIQVGDRRPALEEDARDQAHRVHQRAGGQQRERRRLEHVRAAQPGPNSTSRAST